MLRIVVNDIATALSNVNNSERITFAYEPDFVHGHSPLISEFKRFYRQLPDLLRVREKPPTDDHTNDARRKPRYSSPGMESAKSGTSGVSGESDAEHLTQALANAFLYGSHETLREHLRTHAWFPPNCRFEAKSVPLGS